jgi:acyl-CoA thioesterase
MTIPPGPFARLVGLACQEMGGGAARFSLAIRPDHLNPHGVVHGGVLSTLVDTAMGAALTSRLEPGERCTTLELKINYVAPAADGTLRCEARVVERTRRVAVLEARVHDAAGRLLALATGSFYIAPRGPAPEGRAPAGSAPSPR